MKTFSMILASDSNNGIGLDNKLPWHLKKDMIFFKKTTLFTSEPAKVNALIMGRKTWESIPDAFRPLPGRINCVLSRQEGFQRNGALCFSDFDSCIRELSSHNSIENIYVIGGAHIYNMLLSHKNLNHIYLTHVEGDFGCDTFFDGVPSDFELRKFSTTQTEKDMQFQFFEYKKKGS